MATSPHSSIYNGDFPKLIRESGFIFDARKTNSRIDWNEIRAIDIERLVLERDFRTIDNHIYEVLNCQLDTEFDLRILDSGFVKLFRLAQLSVEYLLQCRRQLDTIVSSTKEETKQLREEKEYLKRQMNSKEEEIRKLNNKVRKRHKSAGVQKYDEISEFLKNLVLNGSTNTTLSVGEQNLAALYKCVHCEKLFLNQFFLQAHVTRRHLNAINDKVNSVDDLDQAQPQENEYKKMTEKLYREIEEMRERLSVAERRHFDEFLNPKDKNENIQKDEIESNEKTQNNEKIIDVQSTSKDPIIVNTSNGTETGESVFTKDMFEEWRKQEQAKYASEMNILKTQLIESMNQMKENIVESSEKNDKDESSEKLMKITNALKKQEEEVMSLKEQLSNKTVAKDTEIATKLETQEKFWKSKVQSLEEQYIQTINELRSNMTSQANESQMIQQQYQIKIDSMEKNLKEQFHTLEEQSRKLENLSNTKNAFPEQNNLIQPLPRNLPVQKRQNLVLVESQETLPPYEDNSNTSNDDAKIKIVTPNKYLRNNKIEISRFSSDSNSELSSEIEQKDKNKGKLNVSHKKPLSPKKLLVDKVHESNTKNKHSSPKNMHKKTKSGNSKNKRNISKEQKSKSSAQHKETDTDSDLEDEPKNLRLKKNKKGLNEKEIFSMSLESILASKPNLTKAVKKDLKLLVKKRLKNVGIQSKAKGISSDDYKKGLTYVHHKQQLMSKQYHGYNKCRKNIMKNLNEKLKQLDMSERTSTSSILEHSKTSPFRAMGSLIANVKNKALSMVRSRENLKLDTDSILPKRTKTIDNKSNSGDAVSSPKLTAKSILAMLDSTDPINNMANLKKVALKKKIERDSKNSENSDESSNETSDDDEESEYSDPNKIESAKIVTTAISHMPSKSIEDLLNSPVRKPSLQIADKKNQSPIKTVDVSKVTVPKSEIQLHSPGRFSKSKMKEDDSASGTSDISSESELDEDLDMQNFPARKAVSEDNVSMKKPVISPKGVLKSVASVGSLTKKKVLFDLDAKESTTELSHTQKDSSSDDILKMKINEWDMSEEVDDNLGSNIDLNESINLSTKQSPKIAEISKMIQSQLDIRSVKPPVGSVDTMLKVDLIHSSPSKSKNDSFNKQPIPAPRVVMKEKSKIESDLELSDWSIDDIVNMK